MNALLDLDHNAITVTGPNRLPEEEIIHAATLAPSPDNNQPWRFRFEGGRLIVYHDRRRALPSDVDRMFDLISLGAAVENACIAARHFGFDSQVTCLADNPPVPSHEFDPVAAIEFSDRLADSVEPLFPFLTKRCTCRRGYSREPIGPERLARFATAAIAAAPTAQVDWITERRDIRRLAWLVAAADRVRFEHRPFHEELYRQLRFSIAEAEATRDGLDLRTLDLPPGAALALRALKNWTVQRNLNRFGLSRLLSLPSAMQVWRSGAIGLLSVPTAAPDGLLAAGRAFERLWLTCQAEGIALHPLGGLPILLRRPSAERLTDKLREIALTPRGRVLAIMFRIGFVASRSVRSLRRVLGEVLMR